MCIRDRGSSVPPLGNTLLLLLFFFLVFGIAGLQLFSGVLKRRCFDPTTGMQFINPITRLAVLCGGAASCPAGYECGKGLANPSDDTWSFDNIFYSMLAVLMTVTMEGWSDLMKSVVQSFSYFAVAYSLLVVILGAYVIMNLVLAVITNEFTKAHTEQKSKLAQLTTEEREAIEVLKYKAKLIKAIMAWRNKLKFKRTRKSVLEHMRGFFSKEGLQTFFQRVSFSKKTSRRKSRLTKGGAKQEPQESSRLSRSFDKLLQVLNIKKPKKKDEEEVPEEDKKEPKSPKDVETDRVLQTLKFITAFKLGNQPSSMSPRFGNTLSIPKPPEKIYIKNNALTQASSSQGGKKKEKEAAIHNDSDDEFFNEVKKGNEEAQKAFANNSSLRLTGKLEGQLPGQPILQEDTPQGDDKLDNSDVMEIAPRTEHLKTGNNILFRAYGKSGTASSLRGMLNQVAQQEVEEKKQQDGEESAKPASELSISEDQPSDHESDDDKSKEEMDPEKKERAMNLLSSLIGGGGNHGRSHAPVRQERRMTTDQPVRRRPRKDNSKHKMMVVQENPQDEEEPEQVDFEDALGYPLKYAKLVIGHSEEYVCGSQDDVLPSKRVNEREEEQKRLIERVRGARFEMNYEFLEELSLIHI
eukprot:TRINITY_DN5961_c0_g1_i2.p1 TRINITY_DN5961_c0_g1~~TRINITY_DN5961_c0_g1_i2.p1  ORF type:complete len:637 (-),score=160.90 TRINITY_DN5961_c0_g1_i2:60-1970(-)